MWKCVHTFALSAASFPLMIKKPKQKKQNPKNPKNKKQFEALCYFFYIEEHAFSQNMVLYWEKIKIHISLRLDKWLEYILWKYYFLVIDKYSTIYPFKSSKEPTFTISALYFMLIWPRKWSVILHCIYVNVRFFIIPH